jgi:hypothetical protein
MKLSASILALSSFALYAAPVYGAIVCMDGARNLKDDSSPDLEGASAISTPDCKLACAWGANKVIVEERRLRANTEEQLNSITLPGGRQLKVEKAVGADLTYVDCTLSYEGLDYLQNIPFPEGWTEVFEKGDGTPKYFAYSTSFEIALNVTGKDCYAEGSLELEFNSKKLVETNEDPDKQDEVIIFDDQSIGVSC